MPRRTVSKCVRRNTSDDQLDDTVESNLTCGSCFGHWDLQSRVEFSRPWLRWGEKITRRWIAAFPGSRPMASYILGLIPPPTWQHELPALRHTLRRIAGVDIQIADTAWHKREAELEHLDALGLIDDDEYELALERLAARDATYHGRYQSLARD
jgi:hypothetical protein